MSTPMSSTAGTGGDMNGQAEPMKCGDVPCEKLLAKYPTLPDPGSGAEAAMESGRTYDGELQLLEDYRSPSITFSDLTDTGRFTCSGGMFRRKSGKLGLVGEEVNVAEFARPPLKGTLQHPQLEFDRPHHRIHVHLEDKAAGLSGRTLWDATYDLKGTESLKAFVPAEKGGGVRDFNAICPPLTGPPHWYELTVTRAGRPGVSSRMMEDFIGSQVIESYRPDHDPLLSAFSTEPGHDCVVQ
eukprot:gnl/TRDRNA2_/TRDRNA2_194716_c0_seq1.p1 gnl/TRDRNA2_/TRDRNA2_194716_c0~~gnl/TRDRNA2_/TRDRNA2_194716_c0_seq1.p1  ORF type:complete len:283 (+),score=31.77 gnl/TRDRNA2_/TRDRNA2_194716_c0_seq1:129-851(+)